MGSSLVEGDPGGGIPRNTIAYNTFEYARRCCRVIIRHFNRFCPSLKLDVARDWKLKQGQFSGPNEALVSVFAADMRQSARECRRENAEKRDR
jgi:hypothetical protein